MLYILLTIIAIGVLLASEGGRMILGSLYSLATWVIGWGIFLLVLALFFGVLAQPSVQDVVNGKIGAFIFVPFYSYLIYRLYLGYKAGRQDKSTFLILSVILGALIVGCLSVFW